MPAGRQVTEIRVRRIRGGWSTGAEYSATLRRDGTATYEGVQQVTRLGKFEGTLSRATFDSVARLLIATPYLLKADRRDDYQELQARERGGWADRCFDMEMSEISVVADGRRRTIFDACRDTNFETGYVLPAERVVESIAWKRVQ